MTLARATERMLVVMVHLHGSTAAAVVVGWATALAPVASSQESRPESAGVVR